MATYAELKERIATEMVRDDLLGEALSVLESHIRASIRRYGTQNWWFLSATEAVPTVAGQNFIVRPVTIERIERLSIPATGTELCREKLATLEMWDEPNTQSNYPYSYAENGAQLRLWPTPNAIYALKIVGTLKTADLVDDGDENVWTTTAEDLIVADAKRRIYRNYFLDLETAALAQGEVQDALDALNRVNVTRYDAPIAAGW